jgi:hypothetical protein
MNVEQMMWTASAGWQNGPPGKRGLAAQLVLLFGSREILADGRAVAEVRAAYPAAHFLGCSTAGEICGDSVSDDSLVVTAVEFVDTQVRGMAVTVGADQDSRQAGQQLARGLSAKDLIHVLVLSKGLDINGSELVKGLMETLPRGVSVTGGLSGDGERFQETWVLSDTESGPEVIAAVGFYGRHLKVGYGSLGGWDMFGPERLITRAKGNVLYELDGKSALELYKQYLGKHAGGLPATGLLFPLSIRSSPQETGIVRTILSVNEEEQSITFAGNVPEGSYARLMRANFDRLIDGAIGAAQTGYDAIGSRSPDLALLISCVGRKMVLRQRVEEEVEGVREVMGEGTVMAGFYSYGEISPFTPHARCELHNQTMTITTLSEDAGSSEAAR